MRAGWLKGAALIALAWACGCERTDSARTEPPPAAASRQEVAELQRALAADAARTADTNGAKAASAAKAAPTVMGFSSSDGRVEITLSEEPDLTALRDFIKISPDPGPLTQDYLGWRKTCVLKGAFKPRTAYQLVVKKGLPMAGGGALEREFRRTWTMVDHPASVAFASAGRYLPTSGSCAVSVKTMNVTNLVCRIRPVPVQNLVQLLAREEDCYGRFYGGGGDSADAAELADAETVRRFLVKAQPNEDGATLLEIRDREGARGCGVYLVSAENAGPGASPGKVWKLVCVTDLGLSVRRVKGALSVWATSLTGGVPLQGIRVRIYGENNIEIASAETDAEGWCCCDVPKDATPFAVVAAKPDGSDVSFLSLRGELDETLPGGGRRPYVADNASEAFVWTDRGIYRHNEPILVHAILRDGTGSAPRPFPVQVSLLDPDGKVFLRRTQVSDAHGVVARDDFAVTDDQKSGVWTILVQTPGDDPSLLGACDVRIEEFVPPQIRVKVTPPAGNRATTNLLFTVAGEHLFGGAARGLPVDAAVMFEDAPFAPRGWEAFRFGDVNRRLQPNFKVLDKTRLGEDGAATFTVDFPARARPRAAVKMTLQGSVFENGGRPASARATACLHAYPYYIGVQLPEILREGAEPKACRVALVDPDGAPHAGARTLTARFERVEYVYGLKKSGDGCWEWRSDRVRYPLGEPVEVAVAATGSATLPVPVSSTGDFTVTLAEEGTGISFAADYCVAGAGDGLVRTALENPSHVTIEADRKVYHPGERPRLRVKAPFVGFAWLNVLREELVYSQVIALTNATSEIVLEPVTAAWAPGVDVTLSVVQAATAGQRAVANRAFGLVPIRVAARDSALDVKVRADVTCPPTGGARISVSVDTRGEFAVGERAVVTVVDEGINLLTGEKVPDPVAWFGETRDGNHPLWDIFNRLLPILDDRLKRAGAKTGGGAEGDLFRRVSPIPSRRFKPLSMWKLDVPLEGGCATVPFVLPEFVGEVRVTAVAYNRRATGSGSAQVKVAPRLVMQPDAPRFAAPGDTFLATVTLANRSGAAGNVVYDLLAGGSLGLERPVHGELKLADGQSETLTFPVRAGARPGQGTLAFVGEGFGEKHKCDIELPVRPAVPWTKTAQVVCLRPGEEKSFENGGGEMREATRRTFIASASPVSELAAALDYLVSYPYGCLEQTVSRVFPLIAAGGILNTLPVRETSVAEDAKSVVDVGIRRVCSMLHENDFSMWPDSRVPPWDREVSLWAAHFLVEAARDGFSVPKECLARVRGLLKTWAMSTNEVHSVYACQTLAVDGNPDRDRMLHWYDRRSSLALLERARLARAFARSGDRERAERLMEDVRPRDVEETAWALLALMDLDSARARLPALVTALTERRDHATGRWATTRANAHALLALGGYYRMIAPPSDELPSLTLRIDGREEPLAVKKSRRIVGGGTAVVDNRGKGPAFVSVSSLVLPAASEVEPMRSGIGIERRFRRPDGEEADLETLVRGELLIAEVVISAPAKATYSDLVVEDLLPACFEVDSTAITTDAYPWAKGRRDWELRRELRDDRMLAFSRRFALEAGASVRLFYAVRVVSAGDFALPGVFVEAMYEPEIRARGASRRIRIAK